VIDACRSRISMPVKLIDLVNDCEDDYEDINCSNELDFEAILGVASKHGIVGPCFAVEVKIPGSMGHFINIQRSKPESWLVDETGERPDERDAQFIPGMWKLDDFQIYCQCEETHERLQEGTVRLLMGRTQAITTVFGTKPDPGWAKEPRFPLVRELRLRTEWEPSQNQWKFSIHHHGTRGVALIYNKSLTCCRALGLRILCRGWTRAE
jgi:hypothetical protein